LGAKSVIKPISLDWSKLISNKLSGKKTC
jgi:hypothetical protein